MAWKEFRKTINGIAKRRHPKTGKIETGMWYVIGRHPLTGERICEAAGALDNIKEARDKVEAIEAGKASGAVSTITLKEAYGEFEDTVKKRDGSPLTWPSYRLSMDKLVTFLGADMPVSEITRKDIKKFKLEILNKHCVNGMFNVIGITRTFLAFCVENEHITSNPADKVASLDGFKKKKVATYLSDEQVRIILDAINNPSLFKIKKNWDIPRAEFKDIVLCSLLTGMREGDLASFRRSWVEDNRIYITKGKGDKSRIVPINSKLWAILKNYLDKGGEYVFQGWNKNRIKCQWSVFYGHIKGKIAELPRRCRFHDLRHTFAKNFLRGRGGLKRLQMILGHSSITTTADLYGHLEADDLTEDMENLKSGFLDEEKPR